MQDDESEFKHNERSVLQCRSNLLNLLSFMQREDWSVMLQSPEYNLKSSAAGHSFINVYLAHMSSQIKIPVLNPWNQADLHP